MVKKIANYTVMAGAILGLCMIGQLGARAQNTSVQPGYSNNATQKVPANVPGNVSNNTHPNAAWRVDRHFVRAAGEGGIAEVRMGQLAATKAVSPAVKTFAQRMVRDHSEANASLQRVAANSGVAVPDKMSVREHREEVRLSRLQGHAFDRAYINYMIRDHRYALQSYQHEARYGHNQQIKNFAAQTVPVLQNHLQQAQSLQVKRG